MSQLVEGWAVHGVDLPETFHFPITKLGFQADVRGGGAYVAADMETALAEGRPYFEASYEVFGDWGLFADVLRAGTRQLRGAELRRGRLVIGGPEDCLEQIAAARERVPIGCLILRMQWLGMPHARVARAIELVGTKLMPELRRL